MSLDVTLYEVKTLECECGKVHELGTEEIYEANITHNLNKMAEEAGIYEACWRPYQLREEYDKDWNHEEERDFAEFIVTKSYELIDIIEKGLGDMKAKPDHYEQFNSPNGWGLYENFVPWVENYLEALKRNPNAIVVAST